MANDYLADDGLSDPHALGQFAAQSADVKPVAATPPPQIQMPMQSPAAPVDHLADEPSLAKPNTDALEGYLSNRGAPGEAQTQVDQAHADYAGKLSAVSNALGGDKFDPNQGVSHFWDALRVASIDKPSDRMKYLQGAGYNAKVIQVPGVGAMTVFQNPGDPTWHPINGQDWSMGDAGKAAAAAPGAAAQIGTVLATDGASLPLRMAAQFGAGTLEKAAEEGANKAAGTNTGSLPENASNAAGAGARDSLGELFASALGYGSNVVKGVNKGVFAPTTEGQAALDAADRLRSGPASDLPALTPGAVGKPVLATRERQIAPLSTGMQNHYTDFANSIAQILSDAKDKLTGGAAPAIGDTSSTVGGTTYPGIGDIMTGMKTDAAQPLANSVPVTEMSQGGNALRQGAEQMKQGLVARTGSKYDAVPDQGIGFNISPMKQTAEELSQGIKAKGYPTTTTVEPDAINAGISGAKPVTTETPTTVTLGEMPAGYMSTIVGQVKKMFPQMETVEGRTPYAQLQNLRTKIGYAASEFPVGGSPAQVAEFHQARTMLGSLDNVLATPEGANAANFGDKLLAAQRAARQQNQVLDNPMIQKIRNSQVPPEDLMSYASPGNYTNLALLKRTMPAQDFQRYQDAWASSLVRNPDRIPGALKAFSSDPRSLNILADPGRQQLLSDYAGAMDKINGSPVATMLAEKNLANRPAVALSSRDADGVSDLITRAGGPESPIGQNLRAAVFNNIFKGGQNLGKADLNAMASGANNALNDPVVQKVLQPDDVSTLTDLRDVAAAQAKTATGGTDFGSGPAVGAVAKGIAPLTAVFHLLRTARTAGDMLEAWVQAKSWSSKFGSRFITGGGGITPGATIAQRVAAGVGTDYEAEAPGSKYNQTMQKFGAKGGKEPALSAP